MDLNQRNIRKILFIIFASILFFVCVQHFDIVIRAANWLFALLSPFIIGLCAAFIFNVLLNYLEGTVFAFPKLSKKKWWQKCKRTVCLTCTYLLIIGLLCILCFLIIPQIQKSGETLIANMSGYMESLEKLADRVLPFFGLSTEQISELSLDWEKIGGQLGEFLKSFGGNMINSTVSVASVIVKGLVNLGIGLVFSVYLLARKESLCMNCRRVLFAFLPEKRAEALVSVGKLSSKTFSRFVSGQLMEAVVIGSLCFVGMVLLRMEYATLISVLIGVTALIPIFGAFIGTGIGAFLLLMISPMKAFWFVVFIIVLQQVESNIIYPKVVGTSIGLPGIWVLCAVIIGGNLFGVAGMIIGIPVSSVVYTLFRKLVADRIKRKGITQARIRDAGEDWE